MSKRDSKYRINIADLSFSPINHGTGFKKVFVKHDNEVGLTQFAYSKLEPGDSCELHIHQTMDEYFFVLSGFGKYEIGDEIIEISNGDFIKIPARTPHMLINPTQKKLELVYFGNAII